MAVDFRIVTFDAQSDGGSPTTQETYSDAFDSTPLKVAVGLQSFEFRYSDGEDRQFFRSFVKVENYTVEQDNRVRIEFRAGSRSNESWEIQPYHVFGDFLVIAFLPDN